mmetsp:Transcript_15957/g.49642  ORF Transcript_15957/g.49642 Transcript_15957/m.49642 type:complete len:724 (+) Transcript_15957:73-2244(+)
MPRGAMTRAGRWAPWPLLMLLVLLRPGAWPRALVGPRVGAAWRGRCRGGSRTPCGGRAVARASSAEDVEVRFSHVHLYADALRPLEEYKALEAKLNAFAARRASADADDLAAGRDVWVALGHELGDPVTGTQEPAEWTAAGQDVVEQVLVGLGWRVTGSCESGPTRSLVLTSPDPEGVKFVVTAHEEHGIADLSPEEDVPGSAGRDAGTWDHFDASHLARFSRHRSGREGIAVLGFLVPAGGVEKIRARYAELHPKLLLPGTPCSYQGAKVLEVFAYYRGEKGISDADPGTVLRFVELEGDGSSHWVLPGVKRVEAAFDGVSASAYCDHWVSNVVSRTGFLDTLHDTLGFTPKVDFNAGVVAAGEAQIESTVTGNTSTVVLNDKITALKDQSQVYLPINNALSEVGHVNVFLKELGQGIQHIASRVEDLTALIQRANDYRKMTGAGLSFLQIPRSYYGYLTAQRLVKGCGLEPAVAEECLVALRKVGIVDSRDVVELDATAGSVAAALPEGVPADVVKQVLRARYGNLYALLRDHVSEEAYLRIVRNNILVDIQGEDLLLQIFTAKVTQRNDGEEAPFLEFIQRVCSDCKDAATGCPKPIKPGCGGFGIRNFLTLFLSIEVSKAAAGRAEAERRGDDRTAAFEARRVDAFTAQLDESNPVLTSISDAMTAEAAALESGNSEEAARWAAEKARGQDALQAVSGKYKEIMRKLREEQLAAEAGSK